MPNSKQVTNDMYSARRKPINNVRKDKRVFGKTADQTHRLNTGVKPRRGGFRL